jgi:hypothetical protein
MQGREIGPAGEPVAVGSEVGTSKGVTGGLFPRCPYVRIYIYRTSHGANIEILDIKSI